MNMTDVATWGQLISSAAVLVTLVYLSIQTKQTVTLLQSESRQTLLDGDLHVLRGYCDYPGILVNQVALSHEEISLEEKARLHVFFIAFMRTREHHWFQYRNGVLDEASWTAYRSAIPAVLGTDWTRT